MDFSGIYVPTDVIIHHLLAAITDAKTMFSALIVFNKIIKDHEHALKIIDLIKSRFLIDFRYPDDKDGNIIYIYFAYPNGWKHGDYSKIILKDDESGKLDETHNYKYVNGVKHGPCERLVGTTVELTGQYTDSLREGTWNTYHNVSSEGRRIHRITPYINGQKNGIEQVHDIHGKLITRAEYVGGRKHGDNIEYSGQSIVRSISKYDNGILRLLTQYHTTDKISHIQQYKDSKKQGFGTEYYGDGSSIKCKVQWIDGEKIGDETSYRRDGSIAKVSTYVNGFEDTYVVYNDRQLVECRARHDKNIMYSTIYMYYPNNQIQSTTEYKNDQKDGEERRYRLDGTLDKLIIHKCP